MNRKNSRRAIKTSAVVAGAFAVFSGGITVYGAPVISYNFDSWVTGTTIDNAASASTTWDGFLAGATVTTTTGRAGGDTQALTIASGSSQQLGIGSVYNVGWEPTTSGTFTVSFWFKQFWNTSNGTAVTGKRDANGPYNLYLTDGTSNAYMTSYVGAGFAGTNSGYAMAPLASDTTNWYMMTLVGNGSSTKMYINGVATPTSISQVALQIGGIGGGPGTFGRSFAKYIDDVSIYDSALTAPEVLTLYTGVVDAAKVALGTAISGTTARQTVNVTGSGGNYIGWTTNAHNVIGLTDQTTNAAEGNVGAEVAIDAPTLVMLKVNDGSSIKGLSDLATAIEAADTGNQYDVYYSGGPGTGSGTDWDKLDNHYTFDMLVRFTGAMGGSDKFSWKFDGEYANFTIDRIAIIPEPATIAGVLGLGSLALLRRRRNRKM